MTSQRHIGVSYGRFSAPKQEHGDSADRQDRMYRDFCNQHNLTPLTEVFLDKGRSGYRDEHRKKGRLGVLIQYAKDRRFEPGTVIVIEAWDRLGRLRPDRQTELVAELLRTGVRIGICRLNDIFSEEDFGTHKWTTLAVFIQLAYQESKQKSERVAESYVARRKAASEGKTMPPRKKDNRLSKKITDKLPAWLEATGDDCRKVPERAAAIKQIFALAARGCGRSRIVAALVRDKVPPFGTAGTWTRSYINRILSDRRVIGEYQPRKADGTPAGPPILGYYPRIISESAWLLARSEQEKRRGKDKLGRALVRSERKYVNLFRGLLVSALDGEGFVLHQKVVGGKRSFVLANLAGQDGRAKTVTFPYHRFEEAVLRLLREVKPDDILPPIDQEQRRSDVLKAKLDQIREDIKSFKEDLKAGYDKHLAELLREKGTEEEAVAGELQEELARSVRPAERAWRDLPGLADLVKEKGDEARLALRPVLRRVVESAHAVIVRRGSFLVCALQFCFTGGCARHYLILYQSAGYNRKGGTWAAARADLMGNDVSSQFNLKHMADVHALETVLSSVDIEGLKPHMMKIGSD